MGNGIISSKDASGRILNKFAAYCCIVAAQLTQPQIYHITVLLDTIGLIPVANKEF